MRNYFIQYASDFHYHWDIAETIFKIPYKFSDGKTTYLSGKIDSGYRTEDNGKLILMDHKCKGQWNIESLATVLPADLQINMYVYCIWKYNEIHDYKPYFPSKFYYNLIRNPSLRPGNLDIDGYIKKVEDDVEKRPSHYYQRLPQTGIPLSQKETEDWERKQLRPVLKDIRRWYDTNYRWPGYYKSSALETRYGLSPYAGAVVSHDYSNLYQRQKLFSELVE
jgi:hypothetical protein